MKLNLILVLFIILPAAAFAKTIHVPTDYTKIQEAIDASVNGDVVIVAPGTYYENRINFHGKAITVTSSDGPEVTVINAQKNGSAVLLKTNEGIDSVLNGFTLKRGSGTWETGTLSYGGAIYCKSASPTILNNIIRICSAKKGGAISCGDYSAAVIRGNVIYDNSADWGGGINCDFYSTGIIEGNVIFNNTAKLRGGGFYCTVDASPLIINNIIYDNSATYYGGGMHLTLHSQLVSNNLISNNTSEYGGGIFFYASSSELSNNVIYGNSALEAGGGIYTFASASPVIHNSTFWKNTALKGPQIGIGSEYAPSSCTLSYCDVEGDKGQVYVDTYCTLNWGSGMIDSDPLFVDPSNGDFHLTYPSPCKDTGDNSAVTELTDFEGDPRIAYGTVDMGADEFYTHLYWIGNATPGGNAELKFVGLPGTTPVQLWLGSGVLDPPWSTKYGDWYLQFPLLATIPNLGAIPSPDGVLVLPFTFPLDIPTPLSLSFQAGIGLELTNLSVMVLK